MDQQRPAPRTRESHADCFLRLHNLTHDTLLIRYQTEADVFFSCHTVIPGQWIDFARLPKITLLQVKGLLNFTNLADQAKREAQRFDAPGMTVTARSGWDYETTNSTAAYVAALLFEKVLSYTYTYHFCEGLDEYAALSDAFCQVKKALQEKRAIQPYHLLNIAPDATLYDAGMAYENVKKLWQKKKDDHTNIRMTAFAAEVLYLCDLAYKAIKANDEGKGHAKADEVFSQEVQKRLIGQAHEYTIKPHPEELLKTFLTVSGILASTNCEMAAQKVGELKNSSARFAQLIGGTGMYEKMLGFLAERYFGSESIQNLTCTACSMRTREAQDFLIARVESAPEWRAHIFFVFKIFENYTQEFYKPIARALGKYILAVNMCNEQGNTPLMEAVLRADFDTVKFLINQNADRFVSNKLHKNALMLAKEKRMPYESSWLTLDREKRLEWDEIILILSQSQVPLALFSSYVGGGKECRKKPA